jgi:hypothetical protein
MRLVLAFAMVFSGSAAFASSITHIGGTQPSGKSIIVKSCTGCVAEAAKTETSSYNVPELMAGTQKTEIIEVHGKKKLARTEAWFGGSPVVYVSKVPAWMQEKAVAQASTDEAEAPQAQSAAGDVTRDGIDADATTSAVEATDNTMKAAIASPTTLALKGFQLRVQ